MGHARAIKSRLSASWQPLLAGALLCILVILIVGNLNRQEEDNLRNEIQTEAENLANHVDADLRNRFSVLTRIAKRWDVHKSVSRKEFTDDAYAYLSHDPGFQALEWVDRNFVARWVVPREGNERTQNMNLAFEKERRTALEKARDSRQPSGTAAVDLVQGGKGFLTFFPIHARNRFEGFVVAVFRADEWLNYVFSFKQYRKSDKFVATVYLDGVEIFRQTGWDGPKNEEYETIVATRVIDRRLAIHIRPTEAFIDQSRTVLPKLTAAFGFLLAILVTLITHLLGERKRAAEELRETLSRVKLLLDSTAEGIYGIDLKGNCTFANPSSLRMLGYESIDQLLGKNMHELIHHSYPDGRRMPVEECRIYRAFREGTGIHYDMEVLFRADGTSFPAEYWSYPQAEDGILRGAVVTFNDITERRQAEIVLQEAKKAAEAANQAKSEFLATMSHEIRTPMNAIIGMAELLAETPLTEEQERYVEVFRNAGGNLLTIIDDILDLSKIEAGRIDIESVGFDLKELVEKTCQAMAMRASRSDLEFTCRIFPDVPVNVTGDPVRLRQIIANLLGNAIKFTEHGGVALEVKREGAEAGSSSVFLTFSVIDTGIGIPGDKLETIFDKFTQADSSTTRKYGGTGLGLPISRRLVQLMGGDLFVESEPGKGTRFFFTLPMRVQEGPRDKEDRETAPAGLVEAGREKPLNILLVDDSEDNCLLVRSFLKKYPYTIHTAENGLAALKQFKKDKYDLVLMDMQMPVMDGYTAVKEFRVWERENGREPTPVIALTAYALKEEMQKSIDAGCDAHLTKPIKKAVLLETIRRYARI